MVAKILVRDIPPWRWYFEREIRLLERLPATLAAPRLIAADAGAGVMIVSRVAGRPLAARRRVSAPVPPAWIDGALAIVDAIAGLDLGAVDDGPPPGPVIREMRGRLLEDPTAPRGWFIDGVDRCRSLALFGDDDARRLGSLFEAAPVATGHGDLLPRNIVADPATGDVGLIDWECAGSHLGDWDRALLWANLDAAGRSRVAATAALGRIEVFRGLCAFALAREVKFARPGSPSRSRLEADLAAALANCRR